MWNRYLLLLLTVPVALLTGCTKNIRLTNHPQGEVSVNSALEFEFSDSLAPADSVGTWTTTAYLKFDPPIEGNFKWLRRNMLTFIPKDGSLPGATDIKVTANEDLFFGKKARMNPSELHFNTPYFKATEVSTSWADSYSSEATSPIDMQLRFTYPVEPEELRSHLEIYDNGRKIEQISFYHYSPTTEFQISADLGVAVIGEQHIEVRIKPGLQSTLGRAPLTEMQTILDTLKPMTELAITDVQHVFNDGKFEIHVDGNQGIAAKTVATFISLVPNMPFDVRNEGKTLVIISDFRPGGKYGIALRKGMLGVAGGSLPADFTTSVTLPSLKPFARFSDDKGHFLMRNGYENLNVKATNITYLDVKLYEIYENNLLHFLRTNPSNFRHWNSFDSEDEYYYGDDYGYLSIDEFGAQIHEEKVMIPKTAENEIVDVPIKLQKQFRNKFKGIFAIQIENNENSNWIDDYKIVSLSDLGIIAKWNKDDLLIFVNYLSTALPAVGAKVSLISATNQAYLTGTADGAGVVKFAGVGTEWESRTFVPRLVTAQTSSDFQFLDFDRTEIDRDRFDIEGKSREAYDVFCYGDRNIYRPGDTLYFSAIVRNWDYGTPKGLPVTIKLRGPEGGTLAEIQKNTNDKGAIELSYPVAAGSRTGTYYVDVETGLDEHYAAYEFQVEDFVPDKIKVRLSGLQASGKPGDTLRFPLEASYYFGSPCALDFYEVKYRLTYTDYRSKRYPQFDFREEGISGESEWAEASGQLNDMGRDTTQYIVPSDLKGSGILLGTANATVFDNTGHPVRSGKTFSVSSRTNYLGLREHGSYFNTNDTYNLEYVAVNYGDQPAKNLKMEVRLVRFDWKRAMRKESNGFYYVSESESVELQRDTITQQGDLNRFAMRLTQAGNYELTITLLDSSGSKKRTQFSAYGKSVATASSFGVTREGTVAISFDKTSYKVGENARVLLTAPFSGRMLLTLERDKVYEYRYVDVQNNAAEVILPIRDAHVPNVWVTATLFRPQKNKGTLPMTVAHGYAGVKVDNPSRNIPIKITAPEQIKPGKMQTITVQAKPGAKLTVAVVDEGILAIKHFRTPDPYTHMYEARELEVRSYDMYEFLLPEVPNQAMASGGDDMGEWASFPHMNPVRSKRFKPFAYWSGIKQADGAGRVTLRVPFPEEFNGRARIMVVAYDGASFGSGDQGITVRNDLVVMAAIPRFMTAGDSLSMPVNLMNMTEKDGIAKVKVSLQGPLKLTSIAEQSISVPAEGSAVLDFGLKALKTGPTTIVIDIDGIERLTQRVELAVRPPTPIASLGGTGMLAGGQSINIAIPAGFEPEIQQTIVALSPFPALEFGDQLDYLLHYPHGCVEQTVSAAFPQLYFADLAELIAPDKYKGNNAVYHVREAIKKLESMQLYSGGFSYWQGGDGYESKWGSVFATHFLLEARKAGFAVQEEVMNRALNHILEMAKEENTFTYHYTMNGRLISEEKASKERIYSLFVLALAQKADLPLMNYFKSHPGALSMDGRFLLAATFALNKDMSSFEALLPKDGSFEQPERLTGGSFDSPMRSAGVMLNALVEADPGNPRISNLVQYIRQHKSALQTTQENAWVFLGLGKMARSGTAGNLQMALRDGTQSLLDYNGANVRLVAPNLSGQTLSLTATGKGEGYYYWKLSGIRKGAGIKVAEVDKGLKVRRTWITTDGQPVKIPIFHLGELVVCRVEIEALQPIDNVVISDMIPAGFEVENTRLTNDDYSWIKNMDYANDNLDIRDDRVNCFMSFPYAVKREFKYLVRAVNLGNYLQPAIVAEAMYDPAIQSVHSGQIVRIVDRDAVIPGRSAVAQASSPGKDSLATPSVAQGDSGSIWQRFMKRVQP
jgi:alpha-2-macroglobulin